MDEVAKAAQQARRLVAMNLPSEELHERLERDHGLSFMPLPAVGPYAMNLLPVRATAALRGGSAIPCRAPTPGRTGRQARAVDISR